MHDQELQRVSKESVLVNRNGATEDSDRADMVRLGKKPVLRVGPAMIGNFLPRLMCSVYSVTLGSCPCWDSAAPFLRPGKQH